MIYLADSTSPDDRTLTQLVITMSRPFDSAFPAADSKLESPADNGERNPGPDRAIRFTNSFCDQIAPQAKGYAMSILRVWADAEEVVQESFCRLLQAAKRTAQAMDQSSENGEATPTNSFQTNPDNSHNSDQEKAQHEAVEYDSTTKNNKAILFATIRNLSIDHLRRNGRLRFEPIDDQRISKPETQSNDRELEQLESSIQNGLKELPSQWAEALQLKVNGQLSYDEIANVLGATHAQVRTWIFRARKQLGKELAEQGLLRSEK
jgi:RNA polymerase sigma factor (sigma-70 family)